MIYTSNMAGVVESTTIKLSDYCRSLKACEKERYVEKVKICGFDPYLLKKSDFSEDYASLPAIEYPDIVNYLVLQTSWATKEQMKAYKSLEAYNFFVSGWVNTLFTKHVGKNRILVHARVNHSQRARDTPLKPWILSEKEGTVTLAHCDCMAGLSEACSHIGAVLFATESAVKLHKSLTCTQQQNKWLMPAYVKEIPYLPISHVDFSSAKKKYSQLCEPPSCPKPPPKIAKTTPAPSKEEMASFFTGIASSGGKPAVLSVIADYNEKYVPKQSNLPEPLQSLFQERCMELDYLELLNVCDNISIALSPKECNSIEAHTRQQSHCKAWFNQRAGRITASRLKAVCCSSHAKPSKSLVKTICYPEAHKFKTVATRWGCMHESTARDAYRMKMCQTHTSFIISDSGLQVQPCWPHLGASPDGITYCDCCGKYVCEVKCPFCYKGELLEVAANQKNSCLIMNEGKLGLDHKHAYYYQVQAQIFICDVDYCDFVVWTESDIHVERVFPNITFWEKVLEDATKFFKHAILPELVGKWFTQPAVTCSEPNQELEGDETGPWCYCQKDLDGVTLIGCDNESCKISWFHLSCLKLESAPKGKWYCPTCWKTPRK